jgi:hypothetical protein
LPQTTKIISTGLNVLGDKNQKHIDIKTEQWGARKHTVYEGSIMKPTNTVWKRREEGRWEGEYNIEGKLLQCILYTCIVLSQYMKYSHILMYYKSEV